ncbi:MAG: glycoside-pentoside-hexuronide (GPH):cation symporter [Planctomycetota bacterium]|jgi:GPH family glycoside/pentoside/hexuronide:cation symporter|nr:glycoside-pentoside-hexuronide (GPH):cation symporter [Planctomycetota bacterium]
MRHLTLQEKIGYGFGDAASNFGLATLNNFINTFWIVAVGLKAPHIALIIMISKVWDGINDPIMGYFVDRTKSPRGKARIWLLWMAVPFGVSCVLAFSTFTDSYTFRVVWAFITYNLVNMIYTMINIPYGVLAARMTDDQEQRGVLNMYRMVFAFGTSLVVGYLSPWLLGVFGGDANPGSYTRLTIVFGIVAAILFILTFFMCREQATPEEASLEEDVPLFTGLKTLIRNDAWIILLLSQILLWIATSVRMGSGYLLARLYYKNAEGFGTFVTAMFLPMLIGIVILAPWMFKRLGKGGTTIVANIIGTVYGIVMLFIATPENFTVFIALFAVTSLFNGPYITAGFAMFADAIDYGEWKTGTRVEGLTYAASSLGAKVGMGLGGAFLALGMAYVHFVEGTMEQSAETIEGLKNIHFIIPTAACVLTVIIFLFYKTDRKWPEVDSFVKERMTTRRILAQKQAETKA